MTTLGMASGESGAISSGGTAQCTAATLYESMARRREGSRICCRKCRRAGFGARFTADMSETSTSRTPRKRQKGWLWLGSLVFLLVALAGAERALRWAVSRTSLPTGSAQWIWAAVEEGRAEPQTFYLVRDFHLDFRGRKGRLRCLADEEYVAILNGVQIGGGRFDGEGSLDEYSVGRFLKRGKNRLVVEARSSRGNGGLLLSLEAWGGGKSRTVVSDDTWRVFRHQERGLGRAREDLTEGEAPIVWGPPPMGRWPVPTVAQRRPTIPTLLLDVEPRKAVRFRRGGGESVWKRLGGDEVQGEALGGWVTFDFGGPVTGYLALEYPMEESPVGLVYLGVKEPDLAVSRPAAVMAGVEGGWLWSAALPRRFRFATVLVRGGSVTGAMVYPTHPKKSAELIPDEAGVSGVFGLRSEELRTPLEDEFRRELHGLPSSAGREDL